ncbi:hypothetical protein HXZ94_06710 [Empedobacter falsenii]|uniref:hypothetical protein n=1 Tax=Empedobacter TaxID=59734 RepID=UPI0013202F1B|nr:MULTISPECIES: hypothetical protein [Empedobacter]MDM1298189.1 hypothetical protein [Empedobacter falsenii]MDM1317736.1 hypothetical protein [Empedobacter falsenii]QHC84921.1 hypothetical protein AS589_09145 [Empedobacter brevis]
MSFRNIRIYLFKNLSWILILLSIIIYSTSLLVDQNNENLVNVLEKAGTAILSSGVFTAVLKSLQFSGIFKEEISKVISGTDFIQNRNDLPELWKEVSKTLYNRKFPNISDELENRILETYFPTNTNFYYEDYNVSINITEINDKFEISYTQICEYKVILDTDSISAILEIENEISDDCSSDIKVINKLEYFYVNGIKKNINEDQSTIANDRKSLYKINLSSDNGTKEFNIKSKYIRHYPLSNENYKLFRVKYLTKGMHVSINFPKDVRVSFFNIGLINGFKNFNEDFPYHICRIHKNDIILPQQGFGMSFEKVNI